MRQGHNGYEFHTSIEGVRRRVVRDRNKVRLPVVRFQRNAGNPKRERCGMESALSRGIRPRLAALLFISISIFIIRRGQVRNGQKARVKPGGEEYSMQVGGRGCVIWNHLG